MHNDSLALTRLPINQTCLNYTLLLLQIYNTSGNTGVLNNLTTLQHPTHYTDSIRSNHYTDSIGSSSYAGDPGDILLAKILASVITIYLFAIIILTRTPVEHPFPIFFICLCWIAAMIDQNPPRRIENNPSTTTS
jgi:hypothetical protein